jgi:hypothetical protein
MIRMKSAWFFPKYFKRPLDTWTRQASLGYLDSNWSVGLSPSLTEFTCDVQVLVRADGGKWGNVAGVRR